ncbi:MAG: exo-alpha-sialidase [Candidatus Hydrogenedentes bacterium]|nr:exo-alpha-sialidase [Candidatus Hydrogenedentota bacterium]
MACLGTILLGGWAVARSDEQQSLKPNPFANSEHIVEQLNGDKKPIALPAELLWISKDWDGENAQMPYLAYIPEKHRLLMLVECRQPIQSALITSEDNGKTWTDRKWISTDGEGNPNGVALGLTYLGNGKLIAYPENAVEGRWRSVDFGATWAKSVPSDTAKERYIWDPLLVLKDSESRAMKLVEASWRPTGIPWASPEGFYSQGFLRSSIDEGQTWSDEVKIPQWLGVNEVTIVKAPNGNWIAACRTDYPKRFAHFGFDHYGGLAVSITKDEGKTWTALNPLYEWGRHHPSMVLLPDGQIVMTYVVRLGYPDTADGFPQFGVEAVVSRDNGQTWDLDHRYVLAKWTGNITGKNAWFCSVQSSSTVILPDGTIVTAFGTGFRNPPEASVCKMDVALVRWRLTP